jgi:hypothetical protein
MKLGLFDGNTLHGHNECVFSNFLFIENFHLKILPLLIIILVLVQMSVASRSKAWVCGHSLAGITGSNAVGGMDVCML